MSSMISQFKSLIQGTEGSKFINEWMFRAIKADGFLYIIVTGERGLGKSVLALNVVFEVFKTMFPEEGDDELWDLVIKHTIFTIDDFQNIEYRDDLVRGEDGRVVIVLWDDFALHTSSYGFLRGEGDKIGEFVEFFEVARENVAVLIVTAATFDMVPPKLRGAPQIIIQMRKRGKGIVYVREEPEDSKFALFKKYFAKKYVLYSNKIPDQIYLKYRRLKRKAVAVKRKMSLLKKESYAQSVAKSIADWSDEIMLIARGIVDLHGNLTEFGKMVIREYVIHYQTLPDLPDSIRDNLDEISSSVYETVQNKVDLAEVFRSTLSQNDFVRLCYACGLKNRDKFISLYKLLEQRLSGVDVNGNVNGNGNGNGRKGVV